MDKSFQKQDGVILVLSLMIMTMLLSIAFGFGVFILSDLHQAREIDNSVVAYYAADSGIERTLFLFRKGDKERISDLTISDQGGDITGDSIDDWDISQSSDYESTFFRQRLLNGQSVKLYFLGRGGGSNTSKSIMIEWYKGFNSPKLQVIFTQLTPIMQDGVLVYDTDINKVEISDSTGTDESEPVCYDFKGLTDYVVELRAVGTGSDYIDRIIVTAYDDEKNINGCNTIGYIASKNEEAISNVTIKSIGIYNGASQEVYANIPPFDPVSGLLGFVLFSDADITKGY